MKWLVVWVVVNTVLGTYPNNCEMYNKYGQLNDCTNQTLTIACYDTERLEKQKMFYTYEEAKRFVEEGEKLGIDSFEIKEIKIPKLQ
jgi:hypothetical protein